MSDTLREAIRAIAVKIETTPQVDSIAGTPAAGDWIGANWTFGVSQDAEPNPENNGALDESAPIATGVRGTVEIRMPLRGSGTAGTAPEIGRLMRVCSWRETVTAAALGVPTAATAGTVNSVTLPATPFVGAAQAYRGMPLLLSGTPASAISLITDYTAARLASLSDTFSPALGVTALCQIPVNVLYSPTSDESLFATATVYLFEDGLRHIFTGCAGSWRLEMMAGKPAFIVFTLRGLVVSAHQAVAIPAGWNTITRPTIPVWLGGKCQLGRATARTDALRYDAGVSLQDIENPEAPQGFDAPQMAKRAGRADLAPYATSTLSPGRFASMQAGGSVPFAATIGNTAGNRIGITLPSNRIASMDRTKRGEFGADQIQLRPDVPDASAFLCFF